MVGGFRSQVVLPVAIVALLLVSLGAIGFSLWAINHEEALVRQQVADNVTAIQEVFSTTAALMEDRTPVNVGDETVRDIVVRAELPVLRQALDRAHILQSGFVAVVDEKAVRYLPSWTTRERVQRRINSKDGSWIVNRVPLREWGLTIICAYPIDELHAVSRSVGYGVGLGGILIGAVISLTLFFLLNRRVLQFLGGEPRTAAEYMEKIADGDLAVDIGVVGNREDSLMSSLKQMQLKLKNLMSAISGGAAEVNEQSQKFDAAYIAFQRGRDTASSQELLRQTRRISRTLSLLEKSIGRFKLSH